MPRKAAAFAVAAPQQTRSRAALARILDAAERLLEEKPFDAIAIAEIAAAADVSVGNFYAKFPTKAALLEALHERYEAERAQLVGRAVATAPAGAGLDLRLRIVTELVVRIFRERRGVLRSLILERWSAPEAAPPASIGRAARLHADLADFIAAAPELGRAETPRARFILAALLAFAREEIVLRPANLPGAVRLGDKAFREELRRAARAYLQAPREDKRRSRP